MSLLDMGEGKAPLSDLGEGREVGELVWEGLWWLSWTGEHPGTKKRVPTSHHMHHMIITVCVGRVVGKCSLWGLTQVLVHGVHGFDLQAGSYLPLPSEQQRKAGKRVDLVCGEVVK